MKKRKYVGKGKRRMSAAVMATLLILSMTACGSTEEANAAQDVKDTVGIESTTEKDATGSETTDREGAEQQADAKQNEEGMMPEEMLQGNRYFGEITAIEGDTITVEAFSIGGNAGAMPEGMTPGEKPAGEGFSGGEAGEKPTGEIPSGAEAGEKPVGEAPSGGEAGEKPAGEIPSGGEAGEKPVGEVPSGAEAGERPNGEAPTGMEAGKRPDGEGTGGAGFADMPRETMTIKVNDDTVITRDGETVELADLQIGDSIMFTIEEDVATNISAGQIAPTMQEEPMTSKE